MMMMMLAKKNERVAPSAVARAAVAALLLLAAVACGTGAHAYHLGEEQQNSNSAASQPAPSLLGPLCADIAAAHNTFRHTMSGAARRLEGAHAQEKGSPAAGRALGRAFSLWREFTNTFEGYLDLGCRQEQGNGPFAVGDGTLGRGDAELRASGQLMGEKEEEEEERGSVARVQRMMDDVLHSSFPDSVDSDGAHDTTKHFEEQVASNSTVLWGEGPKPSKPSPSSSQLKRESYGRSERWRSAGRRNVHSDAQSSVKRVRRDVFMPVFNQVRHSGCVISRAGLCSHVSSDGSAHIVIEVSSNALRAITHPYFQMNIDMLANDVNTTSLLVSMRTRNWAEALNTTLYRATAAWPHLRAISIDVAASNSNDNLRLKRVFAPLQALEYLEVTGAAALQLSADTFEGLSNLQRLELSSNGIRTLQADIFMHTPRLSRLSISSNPIGAIPSTVFTHTTNLTRLFMDSLPLSDIPPGVFHNLTNLRTLTMQSNRIEALHPDLFQGLTSLTWLQCGGNKISTLPPNLLRDNVRLDILSFASSALTALPPHVFATLSSLRQLMLARNLLTAIHSSALRGLASLRVLTLNGNRLSSLAPDAFADLTSLEIVRLNTNKLAALPGQLFAHITTLQVIHLEENKLTSIPAALFSSRHPDVELLSLRDNLLTTLPPRIFQGLSSLLRLHLANNRLTHIAPAAFEGLSSLDRITLDNNMLSTLSGAILAPSPDLSFLSLQRNQLASLPINLLSHSTRLRALRLNGNHLTALPGRGFFETTPVLGELWLHENSLQDLPTDVLAPLTNLIIMNIGANSALCFDFQAVRHIPTLDAVFAEDLRCVKLPPPTASLQSTAMPPTTHDVSSTATQNPEPAADTTPAVVSTVPGAVTTSTDPFPFQDDPLHDYFHPQLTQLALKNTPLLGNVREFFASLSDIHHLTVGWGQLGDAVLSIGDICSALVTSRRVSVLGIVNSTYTSIVACPDAQIDELNLADNKHLVDVHAADHEQVSVAGCTKLSSIELARAPVLDISGTNLPFSTRYCSGLGMFLFFAQNMLHASFQDEAESILTACFESSQVFDFSHNPWLANIALVERVMSPRVVVGTSMWRGYRFEDSRIRVSTRDTVPFIILEGTAITCRVDVETAHLLDHFDNIVAAPVVRFPCDCSPGHVRDGELCVSTALSHGEIAGIALGATVLVALLGSLYVVRYRRRTRREKYLLLEETELKEQLLGEKNSEVEALKKGWQIAFDELELVSKVDEGAFGEVWRAQWDGLTVAVKFVKYASLGMLDAGTLNDFDKELDFLRRTRHPHLVRFFGTGLDNHNAPFLVLEFVDLGSLRSLLHERGLDAALAAYKTLVHQDSLSSVTPIADVPTLKLSLVAGIAKGMEFLHSLNVLHRDLKTGNVLVTSRLAAKITDFGSMSGKLSHMQASLAAPAALQHPDGGVTETPLIMYSPHTMSRTAAVTMTAGVGTPLYMAPETLTSSNLKQGITLKSDVFSFGVMLWEVQMCLLPDIIEQELGADYNGGIMGALDQLYRADLRLNPPPIDQQAELAWYWELYRRCVRYEAAERPSFADILEAIASKITMLA